MACIQGFGWGNLKEREHLEDLDVDERIILRWSLKKSVERTLTGLIYVSIGTGGGFL